VIQENRTPDNLFGSQQANPGHFFEPGVNLVTAGLNKLDTAHSGKTTLIATPMYTCYDLGHQYKDFVAAWDSGGMDGAGQDQPPPSGICVPPTYAPYAYADNGTTTSPTNEVQPYFDIAKQFGFANYMFQTNQGPSFPAHQFLFSGTSAPVTDGTSYQTWFASENPQEDGAQAGSPTGCLGDNTTYVTQVTSSGTFPYQESSSTTFNAWAPPISGATYGFPCYMHRSIADVLDPVGVSWRYYTNDKTSLWTAPNALYEICPVHSVSGKIYNCPSPQTADWGNVLEENVNDTNPGQIFTDISQCKLPNVTFVTPDGAWSDHSGGCGAAYPYCASVGPSWVANLVNNVGQSTCTSGNFLDTVVLITWDDWGGWYDHVKPPQPVSSSLLGYFNSTGQNNVYGLRVPLLVVSAYSPSAGYVSGSWNGQGAAPTTCPLSTPQYCHDFGSILNFIEYVFGSAGKPLGEISSQYHYADYLALDGPNDPLCTPTQCPYSLADFFNFNHSNAFTPINVPVRYSVSYFQNYSLPPQPPDND